MAIGNGGGLGLQAAIEVDPDKRSLRNLEKDVQQSLEKAEKSFQPGGNGMGLEGQSRGGGSSAGAAGGAALGARGVGGTAKILGTVALGGVVATQLLSAVTSASGRLQSVFSILGSAAKLFFQPFGKAIANGLLDSSTGLLGMAQTFNSIANKEGLDTAIVTMSNSVLTALGDKINSATGLGVDITADDIVGKGITAGAILGAIFGGISLTSGGILASIFGAVKLTAAGILSFLFGAATITGAAILGAVFGGISMTAAEIINGVFGVNMTASAILGTIFSGVLVTVGAILAVIFGGVGMTAAAILGTIFAGIVIGGAAIISSVFGGVEISGIEIIDDLFGSVGIDGSDIIDDLFGDVSFQGFEGAIEGVQSALIGFIKWANNLPGVNVDVPTGDGDTGNGEDGCGGRCGRCEQCIGGDCYPIPGCDDSTGGCTHASDCPGDQVCRGGVCVPPEAGGLQHGGIVTQGTSFVAGEAGDEAVLPLDALDRRLQAAFENALQNVNLGGGGGGRRDLDVSVAMNGIRLSEGVAREFDQRSSTISGR